jgi:hypothetical protein
MTYNAIQMPRTARLSNPSYFCKQELTLLRHRFYRSSNQTKGPVAHQDTQGNDRKLLFLWQNRAFDRPNFLTI